MTVDLDGANIVVLAATHNPTIASRDWLISKRVFDEEEFKGFEDNFAHTPVFAQHETRDFVLRVDEARLQVMVKQAVDDTLHVLPQKVTTYVRALPETPYTAVGLNFLFLAQFSGSEERQAFLREAFRGNRIDAVEAAAGCPVQSSGTVVCRNEAGRLRIAVEAHRTNPNQVVLDLNFHVECGGLDRAIEAIDGCQSCRGRAERLVAAFFED